MEPNIIINVESSVIIIIATTAIAACAIASFFLALKIQKRDNEYRQQTSDLFQAIVISNILSDPQATLGSTHLDHKLIVFEEFYKGKTPIHLIKGEEKKKQ
jgi:hypothetical protein